MKRAFLAAFLIAGALAAWPALAAAGPQATCSPDACHAWQPGPVTVHWSDPNPTPAIDPSTCDSVFSDETLVTDLPLGTPVTCDDGDANGPVTIYLRIDDTSPANDGATPDRPPDHAEWYTHPVTFTFTGSDALSGLAGCDAPVYSGPDGGDLTTVGTCTDVAGNTMAAQSGQFNYDATPPAVDLVPRRAPDSGGWYNHPVSFTATGSDGASGVASCSGATYSGPDSAHASVSGSCSDQAGNVATVAKSFKYDATPPAAAAIQLTPGNRRIDVAWTLPHDAATVVVLRSRTGAASAPKLVYAGHAHSVVDKGLKNGVKYRYTVTDVDQAGNSTSRTAAAVPTASSLRPFVGSTVSAPPRLTWKPVELAAYYNVQLYRGRQKVLSTWPQTASLRLGRRWHYRGRAYTLLPGHYRWYVWPGFGPKSEHRYGKLLGTSSFRVR